MWLDEAGRGRSSVAALTARRRGELARALMTEEVVTREDVVDLEAERARETLADVALEQAFAAHDGGASAVCEQAPVDGPMTRLTVRVRLHGSLGCALGMLPQALSGNARWV